MNRRNFGYRLFRLSALSCTCGLLILFTSGSAIALQPPPPGTSLPDSQTVTPADEPSTDEPAATSTTADVKPTAEPAVSPIVPPRPGTPVYLRDPSNGTSNRYVPVLYDALLNEYIDWLKNRDAQAKSSAPAYSVTSLVLEGATNDDFVNLTATISIQINRDQEWVRVPLKMSEATLRAPPRHEGAGEAFPAESDRESGYQWWFRGKGQHQLILAVGLPLRKQLPDYRFQLTLPPTPVSSLKLRIPLQEFTVKTNERSALEKRSLGDAGGEIEIFGLGTVVDLNWRALPSVKQPIETQLQTATWIAAELTSDSVVLEVIQTIRALQGSFQEVTVRLPADFELIDVVNVSGNDYQENRQDPNDKNRVTVYLKEPTTGSVELKWTLFAEYASLPQKNAWLAFDGFEVVNHAVRGQTGYIAISTVEDYRVTKRDGADRFVHRVGINELTSIRELRSLISSDQIASGYRFVKQPFSLVLDLQPIEPYFTARPAFFLKFSADRAEMEAIYQFEVYRGAVRSFEFPWPTWKDEGWEIEPTDSPGLIELVSKDSTTGEGANGASTPMLRVRLVKPQSEQRFEYRLKARRPIVAGETASDISLPMVTASSRLPATLVVVNAENVEADLVPTGPTSVRPLTRGVDESALPVDFRDLQRNRNLRIESQEQSFLTKVTVHKQHVQTETVAELELQNRRLLVTQRIGYDVAYERLAQIRLLVPRSLEDRMTVHSPNGPLTPNWTGPEVDSVRQVRCLLDKPQLGTFEIVVRFDLELPDELLPGRSIDITVPLIRSSDAEYSTTRFELVNTPNAVATPEANIWKQQLTMSRAAQWLAVGARKEIVLVLNHLTTQSQQGFSISKAAIQTILDDGGQARSTAQYQIEGAPTALTMTIPRDRAGIDQAWWGNERLHSDQFVEIPANSGIYQLDVADFPPAETALLTVDFSSRKTVDFRWSASLDLAAPQFPASVRLAQTLWEVSLPYDQHLFTCPQQFTPQFHWKRNWVFWSRVPYEDSMILDDWVGADDGPSERFSVANRNAYRFVCFGQPAPMAFRSMSQSAIILLGAGLALMLGWILLKIPVTRHVLTVLILMFAMAVVGLWFAEPVELLLQPAILGLLLAVVAALIEAAVKRRRAPTIITLSSPSDYYAPSSSVERAGAVGSEDPTVHRPASSIGSSIHSHSETGSVHG